MLRLSVLLLVAVAGAALPSLSQAAVIITVNDATVAPGGTAFVDIFIKSDGTDLLNTFNFESRITTGGLTRLEFVSPQPDVQLAASNYVFAGDSAAQMAPFPVGVVSKTHVPNDTFIGGDSKFSVLAPDVTLTTSRLLARLEVTAATFPAPVLGDTFTVTFDDTSFNTFFADSVFNLLTIDTVNSDFSGTVTVVPEPSSLLIFAGLLTGFGWVGKRRSRAKRHLHPERSA